MSTKFAVISLWAEDVPACTHFYRETLGLRYLPGHADRPHFDVQGIYLTILKGRPSPVQDSVPEDFPLIALAVDDLDAVVHRLEGHGVRMPWGIEKNAAARWVRFHDPAGNLIELVKFG